MIRRSGDIVQVYDVVIETREGVPSTEVGTSPITTGERRECRHYLTVRNPGVRKGV